MTTVDGERDTHTGAPGAGGTDGRAAVFLDLDTVLLATHPGRYGPELAAQADIAEAIGRMRESADEIVVVASPLAGVPHSMDTTHRVEVIRRTLGDGFDQLVVVTCEHGSDARCECAKPGSQLVESAMVAHGLAARGSWYVCGDQEGVVTGRNAGLKTIRVGPVGEDHLSAVHRPDFEARDLLDAANHILFEALATP